MGKQVLELRAWAEKEAEDKGTGERDNAPRHTDRLWRQVSVSARECLGKARCAFGEECFAERAKERAAEAQLVVTNHSLLAIDAIEGIPMIPEYDAVVVDEAHEVTARITQAATDELSVSDVERAARRAQRYVDGEQADDLDDAAGSLAGALQATEAGRLDRIPRRPRRRAGAGPRRRPRLPRRDAQGGRGRGGRRPVAGPGGRPGGLQPRRADGRRPRLRRALAQRPRAVPRRAAAVRGAAAGVGPDARQAALRQDRRVHQRHADARRRLLGGRVLGRAEAVRAGAGPGGGARRDGRRRAAVARDRRRVAVRLRPAGDPVRRPPPPAARSRRARQGPARRDRGARRRRRGPHAGAVLQPSGGRGRRGGGPGPVAAPDHARPGRRPAARSWPSSSSTTRTPACSARSACGRGSTSRGRPASWCSSTGSRSPGPTTR